MVALSQVLAGQERKHAQVIVEADHALEVQGVVQGGAGRVQSDEAIQGGRGLDLLAGSVLCVGLFELGLLCQRRAGGASLKLLVQADGLFVGAGSQFVLGLGIDLVGTPLFGLVLGHRGAAAQKAHATGQQDRADRR